MDRQTFDGRLAELGDEGAVTAEYAIATIAAVGFAALLVVVLRSDEVRAADPGDACARDAGLSRGATGAR